MSRPFIFYFFIFFLISIGNPYLPVNEMYNQNSCSSLALTDVYKTNFLSNLNN